MSMIKELGTELKKFGVKEVVAHLGAKLGICDEYGYKTLRIPYYSSLNESERKEELQQWFYKHTGRECNLDEPEYFTDMIQWQKLNDSTEIKTRLADKLLVRDWVKEQIGEEYLIQLYGAWDSFAEINFDCIPEHEKFVIKANHGSAMTIVIDDKNTMDKFTVGKTVDKWLAFPFGWEGMQLQYVNIHRKVMAEKFIVQEDGDLCDYKIHCFGGKPVLIQVIGTRSLDTHKGTEAFFDTEWNRVDVKNGNYDNKDADIQKPEKLTEMLRIAETLSKEFTYVRVDLYLVADGIKFGEMTFTPANGTAKWPNAVFAEYVPLMRNK